MHFRNNTATTTLVRLIELGLDFDSKVAKPYHAYSPSGLASRKAVYVHHSREEDYLALASVGIDVKECVAVVKSVMSRNAVVAKAPEKGVLAVVMYTGNNDGWYLIRAMASDGNDGNWWYKWLDDRYMYLYI